MKKSQSIVIILVLALVAGLVSVSYVQFANSTIQMSNPQITNSQGYNADVEFPNLADFSIRGSCYTNGTPICDLTIYVALSSGTSKVNFALATKTIGLELLNSQTSQLAIASGLNTFPLHVSYSEDNSGLKSASVNLPTFVGGATWFYDFLVLNPPMQNNTASLSLLVSAQLIPVHYVGHTYDLQADVQLT